MVNTGNIVHDFEIWMLIGIVAATMCGLIAVSVFSKLGASSELWKTAMDEQLGLHAINAWGQTKSNPEASARMMEVEAMTAAVCIPNIETERPASDWGVGPGQELKWPEGIPFEPQLEINRIRSTGEGVVAELVANCQRLNAENERLKSDLKVALNTIRSERAASTETQTRAELRAWLNGAPGPDCEEIEAADDDPMSGHHLAGEPDFARLVGENEVLREVLRACEEDRLDVMRAKVDLVTRERNQQINEDRLAKERASVEQNWRDNLVYVDDLRIKLESSQRLARRYAAALNSGRKLKAKGPRKAKR